MKTITALEAILSQGYDNSQVTVVTQFTDESVEEFIIRNFACDPSDIAGIKKADGITDYNLTYFRPDFTDVKFLAIWDEWLTVDGKQVAPEIAVQNIDAQQTVYLYPLK